MKHRTGFLSYARRDMKAPLAASMRDDVFNAIEAEVNAAFGGDDFSIWQDTKNLRMGDRWADHLFGEVAQCDFLIPLVSPGYLRSANCRAEFDAFCEANAGRALDGRILPILLRDIPSDAHRFPDTARDFLRDLEPFQRADWTALEDLTKEAQRKHFRQAAKDICAQIEALDAAEATAPPPTEPPAQTPPVDSNTVPVASGYFTRSAQSADAVLANLAFSGPAHVNTQHGRVVFSVRAATLVSKVSGARITDPNFDFGADGWSGPNAYVQRVSANPFIDTLLITAHDGALRGEVLCARGEAGLVRLFDVDQSAGTATLSGHISIDVQAVVPTDADQSDDPRAQRAAGMKAKLAELVHKKLRLGEIEVEDFSDD